MTSPYELAPECWPAAVLILLICRAWHPQRLILRLIRTFGQAVAVLLLTPIILNPIL